MGKPSFEELPFYDRPDLTPYLVHLTKNTKRHDDFSALDNLISILQTGEIWGSGRSGYIKGPNKAACFMDVPFLALKYILTKTNTNEDDPRYEPFGVFVTKKHAYQKGCRPVLYLSNNEVEALKIPKQELWRVVRYEVSKTLSVNWLHEREWRCKDSFQLPARPVGVLVKDLTAAAQLEQRIKDEPSQFKVKPKCIVPLTVVCQGLPRL